MSNRPGEGEDRLSSLDEDPAAVRVFAAQQNQSADAFVAAEDAEAGMTEMSEKFKEKGRETYLPARNNMSRTGLYERQVVAIHRSTD